MENTEFDWEKEFVKNIPNYKRYAYILLRTKPNGYLEVNDFINQAFLLMKRSKNPFLLTKNIELYGCKAVKWAIFNHFEKITQYRSTKQSSARVLSIEDVYFGNGNGNEMELSGTDKFDRLNYVAGKYQMSTSDYQLYYKDLKKALHNVDTTLPKVLDMWRDERSIKEMQNELGVCDMSITNKKQRIVKITRRSKSEEELSEIYETKKEKKAAISLTLTITNLNRNMFKYRDIYRDFHAGESAPSLAKKYNMSRCLIYHALRKWTTHLKTNQPVITPNWTYKK